MTQALRHITSNDWLTIVFIICLVIVVGLKVVFPARFVHFQSLLTSDKYLLLYGKEKNPIPSRFNMFLLVVQLLSFSMLILFSGAYLEVLNIDVLTFVQISILLFAFVSVKYLLEKTIASIFEIESILDQYNFHKLSFRNLIGVLIFPALLFLTYSPYGKKTFFFITICAFGLLNLISLYITVKNHQKLIANHLFYFILYLCAFEIAPYLIVLKLILNRHF